LPDAPLWLTKITPRAALAALAGFLLAVLLGSRWIGWLRQRFREPNVSDSPTVERLHRDKQSTPTMGGLFIIGSLVVGILTLADLSNPYVHAALAGVVSLAALGAIDDLTKLRSGKRGLAPRTKLLGQTVIATVIACYIYAAHREVTGALQLALPLVGTSWSLGWLFVPLAVLVIVGSSNAVNLADGLDGLAGGCLIFAAAAMAALAYAGGHAGWAEYLGVPHIPGCGEMFVVASCMIGGVMGFLWFNCHPAQVFMGDTGSLPLGGLLGILALVARQELLLVIIGGVFVTEALSVIVQVGWYKWRRRRVLLCAPLHHHFQFKGIAENKIVVRFWIASALCALLGVASVKLMRAPESATSPVTGIPQQIEEYIASTPLPERR
jgi:phospho-N-acetylmuramoyl-pentapeptide-transferase